MILILCPLVSPQRKAPLQLRIVSTSSSREVDFPRDLHEGGSFDGGTQSTVTLP